MYFIGIDLGTSAVKLLLTDEYGQVRKIVSRDYPLDMPQTGWSQQEPRDWLEGTYSGLEELLHGENSSLVAGIGVAGQMHGLVILDAKDEVIRPAILWNDSRTDEQTELLNTRLGQQKLTALTGNIAFAGFTAPKLLWLEANERENFERIEKIMLPKDYIVYMLTGIHSCDPSDASGTLLYDVENRCWSKEMMAFCKVEERQLPKLFESGQSVGCVKKELCERFGLKTDVAVCAGAGDNAAAAVGCGVIKEGTCNISLGTSGTVFIPSQKFSVDPANALHSFAHANGAWHQMGCILSAASCNRWWMELLTAQSYEQEQSGIEAQLGRNKVYYLPYLMGERSPHNDTQARSAFIGMSMESTRRDMTQSVLEGVSFAIRDCFEAAKKQGIYIKSSMICGGGAKSRLWCKMLSSVLDIPLALPQTEQGPSYGGAMLAAVAAGRFKSVSECVDEWVKVAEVIEPDAKLAELYEQQYNHWKALYPALKGKFAK